MTNEQLIAAHLAAGGKVTVCKPGAKARPGINCHDPSRQTERPTQHCRRPRKGWTVVAIRVDKIAAAEQWLRERGIAFFSNLFPVGGTYKVRIEDIRQAVLFKLTWGGS